MACSCCCPSALRTRWRPERDRPRLQDGPDRRLYCLSAGLSGLGNDLRIGDDDWLWDLVKQLPRGPQETDRPAVPLGPRAGPGRGSRQGRELGRNHRHALFPRWSRPSFKLEAPSGEDTEPVLKVNSQLFRFMTGILDKRERLAGWSRTVFPSPGQPIMFGGCYFAATGADSDTQQAFASAS